MGDDQIKAPVIKGVSVGLAWLGGMTWGEVASMMAALYTSCLIFEWLWKRLAKPLAISRGWIKGKPRDFMESTVAGDLHE
jgi:hypothetical protein